MRGRGRVSKSVGYSVSFGGCDSSISSSKGLCGSRPVRCQATTKNADSYKGCGRRGISIESFCSWRGSHYRPRCCARWTLRSCGGRGAYATCTVSHGASRSRSHSGNHGGGGSRSTTDYGVNSVAGSCSTASGAAGCRSRRGCSSGDGSRR